jgi:ribulose-5-phosphate 4-epimerase/fuculose-1-phosphate aldolase
MAMTSVKVTSVRKKVSPEEWQARVDLAAAYRLAVVYGMTDMIANHISAAVPGEPGHFLINPYGLLYQEITASCLLKIDLEGNIITQSDDLPYGVNRAGFVIHSAIHAARHDVVCVMHTHSRAGMAVSALKCGLLPLTQTATRFGPHNLAYHDFEGIVLDDSEKESLVRHLGDAEAMILRNHGLLTVGPSVAEAFNIMYRLELSCKTQLDAMACNTELNIPSPEVVARANAQWKPSVQRRFGILEWESLMRELDRIDPTFRE